MSDYIKLSEAPTLTIRYPECGACLVETESGGDGFQCPVCGTSWGYNDGEETPGTLYEDWSGETLEGETIPNDDAYLHGGKYERERTQRILDSIKSERVQA